MSEAVLRPSSAEGMDWFVTYTGRRFWPTAPHSADVELADIAHALSLICRFGGHCLRHYSVAQHSVHVSRLVGPSLALSGLMHDAAEAYLGDVIRPVKLHLGGYDMLEAKVMLAVRERFSLPVLTTPEREELKRADNVALVTERRDLVAPHVWRWREDELGVAADERRIEPLEPASAERLFLERFAELRVLPKFADVEGIDFGRSLA